MLAALAVSAFFYDLTNWHLMALLLFLVAGLAVARAAPGPEPPPSEEGPTETDSIHRNRKRGTSHGA
jgi:hypothetical protein